MSPRASASSATRSSPAAPPSPTSPHSTPVAPPPAAGRPSCIWHEIARPENIRRPHMCFSLENRPHVVVISPGIPADIMKSMRLHFMDQVHSNQTEQPLLTRKISKMFILLLILLMGVGYYLRMPLQNLNYSRNLGGD